ncbi:beta-lactamase [Hyphomonas adhaerens MHS-3]|uniref:Beta-lactamase n=1 Tax=Hyphomonas adhaerens MHS-3 TaxID=1280949 RepID=A0A069E7G9_9PROT|nr:serine hydrolase domain-containing protein [Hyphomonas adhaerens]KCZ86180.1 beta-lactamase [Hyphomonas adhaerens MHS-3]
MRSLILLVLAFFVQQPLSYAELRPDVAAALGDFASQVQSPGASLTIIEGEEIVVDKAIGVADLEQQVPMSTDKLNRIGSISKTVTAAAAIRMARNGQIDFDGRVSDYLEGFDGPARDDTLRQLASHTGCVRGYRDGEGISYIHYNDVFAALALFRDDALECLPGAQFIYSSYGYTLLSAVMTRAAGKSLEAVMHDEVWGPLGLDHFDFDDLREVIPGRVRNYEMGAGGELINAPYSDSSYKYAGAGMIASTQDLARFGAALIDGKFLTAGEQGKMFAPATLNDGSAIDYGLGLYVDFTKFIEARREYIPAQLYDSLITQASGRKIYWHSGTSEGAVAILMFEPEEERVLALALNRGGVEKEAIVFAMGVMTMLREQDEVFQTGGISEAK